MKFSIEIVRDNGEVVYRIIMDQMSPRTAKTKAAELLKSYSGRGATGARISNDRGEELYRL